MGTPPSKVCVVSFQAMLSNSLARESFAMGATAKRLIAFVFCVGVCETGEIPTSAWVLEDSVLMVLDVVTVVSDCNVVF